MIRLEPHADGVILPVRAQPGARRNGLAGEHNGMLKVAVTQVAEKGKANQAIIAVLSKELDLRKSQIAILSGETSREKKFLVQGVTLAELAARIEQLLKG